MPIPPDLLPTLPTRVFLAPWLWAVPAGPVLAGLAGLGLLRRLDARGQALLAAAGTGAAFVAALAAAVVGLVGTGDRSAVVLARGPALVESGALVVEATLALDPAGAVLAALVAGLATLAAIGARQRQVEVTWGAVLGLVTGVLVAIAADDLAVAVCGWELAALAAWRVRGARSRVPERARVGTAAALAAGLLLFWSIGATQRSPEGRLVKDVSLARLVGPAASFEIGARRPAAAPIGVEEAMKRGDRTASSATWVSAGPTLATSQLRDLIGVTSTGLGARLEAQRLYDVPVLLLVAMLVIFAAMWTLVLVPVRRPPPLAIALLPVPGAALLLRFDFVLQRLPYVRLLAFLVLAACLATALLAALRSLRAKAARRSPTVVDSAGRAFERVGALVPMLAGLAVALDRSLLEEAPARVFAWLRSRLGRGEGA